MDGRDFVGVILTIFIMITSVNVYKITNKRRNSYQKMKRTLDEKDN